MLPFECIVQGTPRSSQAKSASKNAWKSKVANEATQAIDGGLTPTNTAVKVQITYYYEGDTPDVDNIIKPIQDALNGIVYVDDNQVVETTSRKKSINGSYQIRGASSTLLGGFAAGETFVHVLVTEYVEAGQLV